MHSKNFGQLEHVEMNNQALISFQHKFALDYPIHTCKLWPKRPTKQASCLQGLFPQKVTIAVPVPDSDAMSVRRRSAISFFQLDFHGFRQVIRPLICSGRCESVVVPRLLVVPLSSEWQLQLNKLPGTSVRLTRAVTCVLEVSRNWNP